MTRLLLVDDEKITLTVLELVLRDAGYEVDCATNGEEALSRAATAVPDVLITDFRLDGNMSGAEVYRALAAKIPEVKLIVLSGFSREDLECELPPGVTARFLLKPCDPDAVARCVAELAPP